MEKRFKKNRMTIGAALLLVAICVPAMAETDRLTVEDPATGAVKFKVTSDGNVSANSLTSAGAVDLSAEGSVNPTVAISGASDNATTKGTLLFVRSRGTLGAPTAVKNNDMLAAFGLNAHNGTAFEGGRRTFEMDASEDWTPTAGGYRFAFYTRNNGTVGPPTERVRFDHNGFVGIGTTTPTQLLDVNGNGIRIRTSKTPTSSSAACNQGDMAWDANFVYVCVATNSWKRSGLAAW